jgi:hypothetical protein
MHRSPRLRSWIVLALSIVPLEGLGASPPHSYVTSIQVPDAHVVTLRTACTVLGNEYHLMPSMADIESGDWQTWVTCWFISMSIATLRAPWFSSPLYKAIQADGMDRPLLTVVPGENGYDTVLSAARLRSEIGTGHLPHGTPVYSVYFNQEVRKRRLETML